MAGLAESVEMALGGRRSDSASTAAPAQKPRMIIEGELAKERGLLAANPDKRSLHEGNILALEKELRGENGGVGGTSGAGIGAKPVMGGLAVVSRGTAQPPGLASMVENALIGNDAKPATNEVVGSAVKPQMSFGERIVEGPKAVTEFIANQASGMGSTIAGGYEGILGTMRGLRDGKPLDESIQQGAAAVTNRVNAGTYKPAEGTQAAAMVGLMESPNNPVNLPQQVGAKIGDAVLGATGSPALAAGYGTSATVAPLALGATKPSINQPVAVIKKAPLNGMASVGAAAAEPSVQAAALAAGASPELQALVKSAGNKINLPVLQRHIEADTLPVPIQLTKGQATQDVSLLSREQNLRGKEKSLADRFNEQNTKLIENINAIKEAAAPDIFVSSKPEIGSIVIDGYLSKDKALNSAISQKYKALNDANGGQFPLDAKQFVNAADEALHKELMFDHVPPNVRATMDRLKAGSNGVGGGMTFENFEALRTTLARIQRSNVDGNVKHAAAIIRESLEQLPMPPGAEHLKPLADSARIAAKERFDLIKKDPAYKAVVEGKASADKLIDRHVVSADLRDVETMKANLADDPVAQQALAAGAMNHLKDSAGIVGNTGNFSQAGYNKGVDRLRPKLNVLFPPENAKQIQILGDVARYTQAQPRGSFVNNSNTLTAAIGATAAATAEGMANVAAHGVPVGSWVRKMAEKKMRTNELGDMLQGGAGIKAAK